MPLVHVVDLLEHAREAGYRVAAFEIASLDHIYNVKEECDVHRVQQMLAHGRAVLGTIPGVRRVFTGRALRRDDRYKYCWLVRFVNPAVVASYRDHPDHVAFANTQFRPVAAERISIDFESAE